VVPGAREAMMVDCNLEVKPVKEGSHKLLRVAQTPEVKTSTRKMSREKKKENEISCMNKTIL